MLVQGSAEARPCRSPRAPPDPLPQGLLPSLEMLRGEALQHGGGTNAAGMPLPRRLKHFPLARLPADAPSRFAALFAEKRR